MIKVTCSLLFVSPDSKPSDVNLQPGVTAEARELKRDHRCMFGGGWEIALEREIVGHRHNKRGNWKDRISFNWGVGGQYRWRWREER